LRGAWGSSAIVRAICLTEILLYAMRIKRSITAPVGEQLLWEQRWEGADRGLIASWERGREKRRESAELAALASQGQLVILPWKGGVDREIKSRKKYGSLLYLAMWQGLRGEDLDVDTRAETPVTCTKTNVTVVFTGDLTKYRDA
jgi:hypothetical protein